MPVVNYASRELTCKIGEPRVGPGEKAPQDILRTGIGGRRRHEPEVADDGRDIVHRVDLGEAAQVARRIGLDVRRDLVGLDRIQELALLDPVAVLLRPFDQRAVGHGEAELRYRD